MPSKLGRCLDTQRLDRDCPVEASPPSVAHEDASLLAGGMLAGRLDQGLQQVGRVLTNEGITCQRFNHGQR